MLTSPTPIKFCTSFNLRRLRSRLTKGSVIGTGKWVRSWCVLLVPLVHPPLLQSPLLVYDGCQLLPFSRFYAAFPLKLDMELALSLPPLFLMH